MDLNSMFHCSSTAHQSSTKTTVYCIFHVLFVSLNALLRIIWYLISHLLYSALTDRSKHQVSLLQHPIHVKPLSGSNGHASRIPLYIIFSKNHTITVSFYLAFELPKCNSSHLSKLTLSAIYLPKFPTDLAPLAALLPVSNNFHHGSFDASICFSDVSIKLSIGTKILFSFSQASFFPISCLDCSYRTLGRFSIWGERSDQLVTTWV